MRDPRALHRATTLALTRRLARSRSQAGLTLVEILMAITIAGLVLGPVGGWMMLALNQQAPTAGRFNDAAESRLLNTYLTRDVSSAERLVVEVADLADCTGGLLGDPLLNVWFVGNERQFIVYATRENDVGSTSLYRRSCELSVTRPLIEEVEVVRDVKLDNTKPGTPPLVTATCTAPDGTLCRAVKVTVESQGDDGDKTITVSATRRSELDPAFLSIPPVQLKVLSTSPRSTPTYEFRAEIEAVFSVPDVPDGLTYNWTATGDATTINGAKTATLTAKNPDSYEVELEVGDGVSKSTASLSLSFENRLPQIDPSSIVINPGSPTLGDSISLSASATDPDGPSPTYSWIGPAGNVICSTSTCPAIRVASPDFVEGRNEIRLVVTDSDSGTQSATREITIGPAVGGNPDDPPTTSSGDWVYANAEYRLSKPVGEDEVTATWSTSDTDLDQMTGWELHRGTPGIGTLVKPPGPAGLSFSHTFAADAPPGDYTIRQLMGAGAPVDAQFRLNRAPVASFVATNLPGDAPYEVVFDDTSTDDESVASWHWEFGYPGWRSDSANPRFVFPNPGTYLVSMDVSDGEGGSDRVVQTVNIGGSPAKPAAVTWVGDSVTFPQVAGASQYSLDITHTGTNSNGSGCLTGGPWKVSPKPPLNEPIVESIVDNPCDVDVSTTVTLQVQANGIWSAKSDPAEKP